jgi:glutamate-1-semialdehyde aminotransferase
MLARGVLMHPRHMWFISRAHTPDDIDYTLAMAEAALRITCRELARPALDTHTAAMST